MTPKKEATSANVKKTAIKSAEGEAATNGDANILESLNQHEKRTPAKPKNSLLEMSVVRLMKLFCSSRAWTRRKKLSQVLEDGKVPISAADIVQSFTGDGNGSEYGFVDDACGVSQVQDQGTSLQNYANADDIYSR